MFLVFIGWFSGLVVTNSVSVITSLSQKENLSCVAISSYSSNSSFYKARRYIFIFTSTAYKFIIYFYYTYKHECKQENAKGNYWLIYSKSSNILLLYDKALA